MEIERFGAILDSPVWIDHFLNGRFHMTFFAVNGLTFFNAFAVHAVGEGNSITHETGTRLCENVNAENETGTLYPRLNINILPLTRYGDRDSWHDEESMRRNIQDAFKANTLYSKCPQMLFGFEERHDFNNVLAMKVLEQEAAQIEDTNILRRIFYIPG